MIQESCLQCKSFEQKSGFFFYAFFCQGGKEFAGGVGGQAQSGALGSGFRDQKSLALGFDV